MSIEVAEKEMVQRTSKRKVRTGVVCSDKMDKTITIVVSRRKSHPVYGKIIPSSKKYWAHDEKNEAQTGDTVEIMETRPYSKTKRWRLTKILERKK
jgi:small subunit ribosomal protein S17